MVDMYFEFTELCTTIPPLEYGGNEVLLEYFASKVPKCATSLRMQALFSTLYVSQAELHLSTMVDQWSRTTALNC